MAILKIYSDIVDDEEKAYLQWDGLEGITFRDVADFIASIPEDDNAIEIHINCAGGDCINGWAIYDALRQSGKEISAIIEGQCSSMATAILLAAPKERRTAYRNAHLCIHNPEACWCETDYYSRNTADNIDKMAEQLRLQAESLRTEQQKLLDLYVERTTASAEDLQALMDQDIFINMDRALELGFIGSILAPNTARKKQQSKTIIMNNPNNKKSESNVIRRLLARLGFKSIDEVQFKDQVVTAADGSELTVEREEGDPQVGDIASPDGSFVLEDGTTIVVSGCVIASITPVEPTSVTTGPEPEPTSTDPEPTPVAVVDPEPEPTPAPADPEPAADPEPEPNPNLPTVEQLEQEIQRLKVELAGKQAELKELEKTNAKSKAEADERISAMQAEIDQLKMQSKTEEEEGILGVVAKMGGKQWLDTVSEMKSTFNVNNRRFVDHSPVKQDGKESKTQKAKREQEEEFARKRNKRNGN